MATPSCCGGPSTGARTWTHATGCAPGNASGENAPARIAHGAGGFGAGVAYVRWSRAGEQSKSHPPRPPPNPETLDARMRHALARGWNTHANPRRPPQLYTRVHHMRSSGPLSNPAHRLARGRSGHFGGFHGPLTLWGCGTVWDDGADHRCGRRPQRGGRMPARAQSGRQLPMGAQPARYTPRAKTELPIFHPRPYAAGVRQARMQRASNGRGRMAIELRWGCCWLTG
jgi:hypothetical protein